MSEIRPRLEVVTGCMFCGKTEELIRRVDRVRIAKRLPLVLKPETDTRYSNDEVVTHYGRLFSCRLLPTDVSWRVLLDFVRFEELNKSHVIAFDEANFFGSQFPNLCEKLVSRGKRVIVAGLDLNFQGQPFGQMPQLLALADEVVKLTAVCMVCGEPATRSQRLVDGVATTEGPEVLIGGLENYEPRCREHWVGPNQPVCVRG